MRDSSNEREANRVKRPELFTLLHNFIESIIAVDKPPVTHLTILQHSLNDESGMIIHRKSRRINIPKKIGRKAIDAFLIAHS